MFIIRRLYSIMVCPALLLQSFIWISLMAKGVQYNVTHIVSRMCVVRQSTVLIPCKHTFRNEQVSAAEWLFGKSPGQRVRVSQDPAFVGRVEFVQPVAGNCSLLLRDVRESDAGIFQLVLSTTSGRNWTNDQGIQLEVTDAELEVMTESDVVMEGDFIMFVCGSCIPSMTVPTYTWMKDGQLHSQHHGDNILVLESVEPKNGGRYSCTISGHEGLNSTSTEITVTPGYPPKSISVSISPSVEIMEGGSVTLNCNSDAKPPAEISWIKKENAVESGRIYSISKISSDHSGEYKCTSRNKYGQKDSDTVLLNVMYAPRNVVVILNQSAEIVEGDSVTLSCSSDSNPPALNFSWFKEGKSVGSGRIYNISKIRSDHSGEYKCKSRNKYGEKDSDAVMLNVMYAPRDVVVTLNSSAEIVEGDSVTLICSSDSNPPALNFSWFKEGKSVESGRIYSISKISSDHSGEYKCRSRNKYGEKDSDTVMLNVMYAPRNVVVILNSSAEIVEGDSVTLSCSSDSNPPALNFSWFKENQSSAVGSGQSFIISSINSSHSGRYYCEAQNQHGSQRSASVSVSVKESSSSLIRVTVGISAAVVLTSVILMFIIGLLIRRKRVTPSEEQKHRGSGHKTLESPEDAYMSLEPKSRCSEYDTLDNMKRSCENTDHPEAQDPIYDSVQS